MSATPTLGLWTRGPQTWSSETGEYEWDTDDDMRKIDTAFAQLQQAVTLLGGSVVTGFEY